MANFRCELLHIFGKIAWIPIRPVTAYTFDFARKVTLAVPENSPDNASFQGRMLHWIGGAGVSAVSEYPNGS
jgi:hypothetical protein